MLLSCQIIPLNIQLYIRCNKCRVYVHVQFSKVFFTVFGHGRSLGGQWHMEKDLSHPKLFDGMVPTGSVPFCLYIFWVGQSVEAASSLISPILMYGRDSNPESCCKQADALPHRNHPSPLLFDRKMTIYLVRVACSSFYKSVNIKNNSFH